MPKDIPKSWLVRKGTAAEFECAELKRKAEAFNLPFERVLATFQSRPFGDFTEQWREFVGRVGEGDELWYFCSPDILWTSKMGTAGFAILHEEKIRDTIVTAMS